MRAWWQSFGMMLTFLTRIPLPLKGEFSEALFLRGRFFFPLIGGLIGLCLGGISLVNSVFPPSITAFLIIIVYLMLVGGLHIDGVGDVFDGIFSARTRERMLVIMEDSHVGAFGVIGLILYFLGMFIGLGEIILWSAPIRFFIIIMMPVAARGIVLFVIGFCRYAKPTGMGKGLVESTTPLQGSLVLIIILGISLAISLKLAVAMGITAMIMLVIGKRIESILQGITGDVVGAVVEIGQVVFLLTCIGVFQF